MDIDHFIKMLLQLVCATIFVRSAKNVKSVRLEMFGRLQISNRPDFRLLAYVCLFLFFHDGGALSDFSAGFSEGCFVPRSVHAIDLIV